LAMVELEECFQEKVQILSYVENGASFALHQGSIRSINHKPLHISFNYSPFLSHFRAVERDGP